MGFDRKYGKVITEHGNIPDDEPVVVFRARDVQTPSVLRQYLHFCGEGGSPQRHLTLIEESITLFEKWQENNPDKVKIPDSERSREWMTE